ncbi:MULTISPECIES: M20/M25/M40 family metallo-hydrolase [unclassified Nitratiruptor]|uniref:M20/M25/M40 family metallo-hydrolase n=1 Tax=unclassified Nitratiruptor TaxID=2624044 RepID=UPI0019167004|nr:MULTISPECIES: M20/M25/M40 family metallo-hydrolase [unclassified Nitratiruptor]BCD59857.1 aminoacyl-histidine dipeptidase [Nitratiruptor sp. YY08-10]BCD63780.1 aminoacyl-histidine dipeptidase [Nitratiruptor sp. YY08-14]
MHVLELFKTITSIPHCSGNTEALRSFITDFAKKQGFTVRTDSAGNILCFKSKRELVFQAHYDMVCVGNAPKIEIVEKDGYLMAKNSSLGADNGIGVAMMLSLMQEGIEAEYLFTNDEEIGLVGAIHLELPLQAKKMINLDSEEFGKVYVGCAGGADIIATKTLEPVTVKKSYFYHVQAKNFPGGHSGVDIDKDIPNAIKEFAFFAKDALVVNLTAGERRNSIPVHLKAVIATNKELQSTQYFDVQLAESQQNAYRIIGDLCGYTHGVRGWEKTFGIPKVSANMALADVEKGICTIQCSVRANSDEELHRIIEENRCYFENLGYKVEVSGQYPAWKPQITPLAQEIAKKYEKLTQNVEYKAIHAGLECAIFAQKFPSMQIVSIGPDIEYPHSVHERVRLDTIEPLYKLIKELG